MQSALDMFMSMRYTNLRFIIIIIIIIIGGGPGIVTNLITPRFEPRTEVLRWRLEGKII